MPGERDRVFAGIEVAGLKELRKALRDANPELAKRLQQVNKRLVTQIAEKARAAVYAHVDDVSPPVAREGPVRATRHGKYGLTATKNNIRGTASASEARVVAGGPKAPGFYGFEFGGSRGLSASRPRTRELGRRAADPPGPTRALVRVRTRQFPVHKGREGYFLYPTIRAAMPTAFEDWSAIFDDAMDSVTGPA